MMTADGPVVLEFNVRFGDPEAQAILPRLEARIYSSYCWAATMPGGLEGRRLHWSSQAAVTVVLASAGYPASSSSGDVISGLERVPDGVIVTPRRHRAGRIRPGRHSRRAGSQRDRARRGGSTRRVPAHMLPRR